MTLRIMNVVFAKISNTYGINDKKIVKKPIITNILSIYEIIIFEIKLEI